MSFNDVFINNKTGLLRSGWRVAIFICCFFFLVDFTYFSIYNIITFGNQYKIDVITGSFIMGIISIVVAVPLSIWMVRSFDKMTATSLAFHFRKVNLKNIFVCFFISLLISSIIIITLTATKIISFIS